MGGLKILAGRRIWRQLFDNQPIGVDTHLTVGLNDVLQITRMNDSKDLTEREQLERKVTIFMERVRAFYDTTQQHAHRHKLESKNRFSVSTLLRPPQLYQLKGNPQRTGPHHNELIDAINDAIRQFNQEVRTEHQEILGGVGKIQVVPGMDMWGMRRNSRKKMQHIFNHFREREEEQMLHLIPKKQAMAAARIIKFFQLCTPNPLGQYMGSLTELSPSQAPVQEEETMIDDGLLDEPDD